MKISIALFTALIATAAAAGAGHHTTDASASAAGGTPNLRGVADVVVTAAFGIPCSNKDNCPFGMDCDGGTCCPPDDDENVDPIVESNCGSDECSSDGKGCPPRTACQLLLSDDCGRCIPEPRDSRN